MIIWDGLLHLILRHDTVYNTTLSERVVNMQSAYLLSLRSKEKKKNVVMHLGYFCYISEKENFT